MNEILRDKDKWEKKLSELMVPLISPDAKLVEIKAKNAEVIKISREVTKLLLRQQEKLHAKKGVLAVIEEEKMEQIVRSNLEKRSRDRIDKDARATRIKILVKATEGMENIYRDIYALETNVRELEHITKENKKLSDRMDSMLNAEINMLKMQPKGVDNG